MDSELLLVVCAANVCRSPLAELLLREALTDRADVRVESAGVHARASMGICELVADRGSAGGEGGKAWAAAARSHRSRPITPELLQMASLVLVADRQVSAEVVRASPEVRDRVFMLRDAAQHVEGFSFGHSPRHGGKVSRFAMHLNRQRAVRDRRPGLHLPLLRRRKGDDSSIVDGHNASMRRHLAALDEVASATAGIAAALASDPDAR